MRVCRGRGPAGAPGRVRLECARRRAEELAADAVLVATGARPATVAAAEPDGERILTWEQVYDLHGAARAADRRRLRRHRRRVRPRLPRARQSRSSLVSSRDRVLPGEDADAATVLEDVFRRRGMKVLNRSRAASAERGRRRRRGDRWPTAARSRARTACWRSARSRNTAGLGLDEAGVALDPGGFVAGRPGLADLRPAASTPPATAPACCMLASRRGDAGPDRDVARPRRRRGPAGPARRCPPTSSPTPRSPRSVSPRRDVDAGGTEAAR